MKATDPQLIWYCPACGGRLSYGLYCKACGVETDFQVRPATERDLLAQSIRAIPPPEYPRYQDDYA